MSDAESLIIDLPDEAATIDLGRALASVVQQADVIALWGNLGAGKTTLARGLIQASLPGGEDVPSPTFTLVQTYPWDVAGGECEIWHFDLYRLEDPSDALELGIEDAFFDHISLIEWPEKLGPYLPDDRLDIRLEQETDPVDGPTKSGRRAVLSGGGDWADRLADVLADLEDM
ncbi:MAG: tRNA (adenosine(37)-N6)-threonylcarbamoyltransferase complex ATPase subunit type 1 TsaE [Alphaproteobacteria bacterium]